jgi:CheY-like chemotaxis protein
VEVQRIILAEVRNERGQMVSLVDFVDGRCGILVDGALVTRWDSKDRAECVRAYTRLANLPQPRQYVPQPVVTWVSASPRETIPTVPTDGTVLVVDDHEDTLRSMVKMLEARNLRVVAAETGKEALRWMETSVPGVVVLDMMMPDMSGLDVLAWMKARSALSKVSVILCSAGVTEEEIQKGLAMGASVYVQKLDETWWDLPSLMAGTQGTAVR